MFTVVVVEDEPLILMNIVEDLTERGFAVIEAQNAVEALAVLHVHADDVSAVFTDVSMPGPLDGIGLAHHAKAHWPWIGLLVTSAHPAALLNPLPDGCRLIAKPYCSGHVVKHLWELAKAA